MENLTLTPGRALVLAGPEGCGKTTLAREIAARYAPFVEVPGPVLLSPFRLGHVLEKEPTTVILDEFPGHAARVLVELAGIITSEKAVAHRLGKDELIVRTPNFIFCTSSRDILTRPVDPRRFHVVGLGGW